MGGDRTEPLRRRAVPRSSPRWEPAASPGRLKSVKVPAAILVVALSVGLMPEPAAALTCMEPDPIDWSTRLPAADAALIGVVQSVEEIEDETLAGQLAIRVRVIEVLHGRAPRTLEYTTSHLGVWGPFYEVGQELAVVIEDGKVSDGQMEICGPWYGPDELRQAASDYGVPTPRHMTVSDLIIRLVERLLQSLFAWYG